MKVSYYNKKSPLKVHCEDAYVINRPLGYFGVMDGVTPIDSFKTEEGYNGAYMASNIYKKYFEETDGTVELAEAVLEANRNIREAMLAHNVDADLIYEAWSTCVEIVRVKGDQLEFAHIGDSTIVAEFADGRIEPIVRSSTEGLGERLKAKREADRKQGFPVPHESFFKDFITRSRYTRSFANQPGGYGIANGMEEVKDFFSIGSLPLASVKRVLLMTDGFYHPELSRADTFRRICDHGFEAYIEEVEQAEKARGDLPDDRTAILLDFTAD